VGELIHMRCR